MTFRAIALLAGTAVVALVADAVRLAVADPLARSDQAASAGASRVPRAAVNPPAAPAAAGAPAGRWKARRQTGVSAGVLVRAASRRPVDRGAACGPPEAVRAAEQPTAGECASPGSRAEPIEIDWHGERASP